jgi:hypothetical protein
LHSQSKDSWVLWLSLQLLSPPLLGGMSWQQLGRWIYHGFVIVARIGSERVSSESAMVNFTVRYKKQKMLVTKSLTYGSLSKNRVTHHEQGVQQLQLPRFLQLLQRKFFRYLKSYEQMRSLCCPQLLNLYSSISQQTSHHTIPLDHFNF